MNLDDIRRRSKDKTPLVTKIIVHDPDGGNAFDLLEETRRDRDFLISTINTLAKNIRNIRDMLPQDIVDCKDPMTPFMIGVLEGLLSTIEEPAPEPEPEFVAEEPAWFDKHPFTCGECSWGRDGAYHDFQEYRLYLAIKHEKVGE